MDEFSKNLISIQWWLGVVVVGIILNLLSAYAKPWLDRTLAGMSTRWDQRTKRKRDERAKLVQYLSERPDEQLHMVADEMRCRLRTILYLVLGMTTMLLSVVGPAGWGARAFFWLSLLIVFMGMIEHRSAMRYYSLVYEARTMHG